MLFLLGPYTLSGIQLELDAYFSVSLHRQLVCNNLELITIGIFAITLKLCSEDFKYNAVKDSTRYAFPHSSRVHTEDGFRDLRASTVILQKPND